VLLVLSFRFFGLAAFVLVLLLIGLLNLRYESAIARATAVTPRALLIRVRGSVRTFALQDIARVRAVHLSWSDRSLYVRPRHGRRGFFYALPRGRIEEILREVEGARRALAESAVPSGGPITASP